MGDYLRSTLSPLMAYCRAVALVYGLLVPALSVYIVRGPVQSRVLAGRAVLVSDPYNGLIRLKLASYLILIVALGLASTLAFPLFLMWYFRVSTLFSWHREYRPCLHVSLIAMLVSVAFGIWRFAPGTFSRESQHKKLSD
jgi:hypothetical protein